MISRPRLLSSTPGLWRIQFGHFSESDLKNRVLRKKILDRDANKCADCGLVFSRHMEVRHLDDDHENIAENNLECVCPFCHLRDHLGPTGFASAGILIGNSRFSQAQINSLTIACWYVLSRIPNKIDIRIIQTADFEQTDPQRLRQIAIDITKLIAEKGLVWANNLSPLVTEPDAIGAILSDLSVSDPEAYARRGELLRDIHVLPLEPAFEVQCRDWFAELDKTRPVASWAKGLDTLMTRLGTTQPEFWAASSKAASTAKAKVAEPDFNPADEVPEPPPPDDEPAEGSRRINVGKRYSD